MLLTSLTAACQGHGYKPAGGETSVAAQPTLPVTNGRPLPVTCESESRRAHPPVEPVPVHSSWAPVTVKPDPALSKDRTKSPLTAVSPAAVPRQVLWRHWDGGRSPRCCPQFATLRIEVHLAERTRQARCASSGIRGVLAAVTGSAAVHCRETAGSCASSCADCGRSPSGSPNRSQSTRTLAPAYQTARSPNRFAFGGASTSCREEPRVGKDFRRLDSGCR